MQQHASPYLRQPLTQPSMADVWQEFPNESGHVAGAVARQVAATAPLLGSHGGPGSRELSAYGSEPTVRPRPYVDPIAWMLLKHLVQVALVASVVLFVLQGGEMPSMALSYVATSLLLVGIVVVADRQRFLDRDPAFDIVEFIAPVHVSEPRQPSVRPGPLGSLVEQMHGAMPERVTVT